MSKKPQIPTKGKMIGATALVVGTSIGAGMLGLPVICSMAGFFPTVVLFMVIWLWLYATARFFLEVNLHLKGEPNFISMAGRTLGVWGKGITWVLYLLLLYALLSAYISGGSVLLSSFINQIFKVTIPVWLEPFLLPILLGGFLYMGTRGIDFVNRFLVIGLCVSLALLFSFLPHHFGPEKLLNAQWSLFLAPAAVVACSFGYHVIIPSLSTYLGHNRSALKKVILVGSLIPLGVYLLWQALLMGVIDRRALLDALEAGVPVTEMLQKSTGSSILQGIGSAFAFFGIATSFLGVALSLSDFLKDGLRLKKTLSGEVLAFLYVFVPPFFFVFFYPEGFYLALKYAGTLVALLLGIIPALMILKWKELKPWKGYHRSVAWLVLCASVLVVIADLWQ